MYAISLHVTLEIRFKALCALYWPTLDDRPTGTLGDEISASHMVAGWQSLLHCHSYQ